MKNKGLPDHIMQGIMFVLLVGGLSQSVIVSLYLPVQFLTTLCIVGLLYLILSVFLWNRRSSAVLISLTLISVAVYIHWFIPEGWWDRILKWLTWLWNYALGLVPLQTEYTSVTAWFIITILAILFYIITIKLRLFIIPLIVSVGIVAIEWILGHSHIIPWLWLLALAFILLLADKYYRYLAQDNDMPDYGLWQASVLPVILAIVLTATIILPQDTQHLQWTFLKNKFRDITDKWSNRFEFTEPRQPFRLSQTGFPSSSDQLGGPVKLSGDIVLEVTCSLPLYLRGTILNEYTGKGWIDSIEDKRYKIKDNHLKNRRNKAFDLDESLWEDLNEKLKDEFFYPVKATIIHTGIQTSVLFNAQRLEDISTVQKRGSFTPYFNGKGETFTSRNISKKEPYTLTMQVPNITDPKFEEYLFMYIPSINLNQPLPEDLSLDGMEYQKLLHIQKYYTAVPKSVPKRVWDLAHKITQGIKTPLDRALAIQTYLQQNYVYILSPPTTPNDVDFVDYFLYELKEGYCTYFATAMAVLCRASGLPTRYVEGFRMPSNPNNGNLYEVRKFNGHAWIEIYFPKVGWITFDPTPPEQTYNTEGSTQHHNPHTTSHWEEFMYPWMQNVNNLHNPSMFEDTKIDNASPAPQNTVIIVLLVISGITASTAGVLGCLKLYDVLRWRKIERMPPKSQLSYCYNEILWLFTLYGFSIQPGETPYKYAQRVDTWLINSAGTMTNICHLIVKSQFGGYPLHEQDMKTIRHFYGDLENNVKSLFGFFPYMYRLVGRRFVHLFKYKNS